MQTATVRGFWAAFAFLLFAFPHSFFAQKTPAPAVAPAAVEAPAVPEAFQKAASVGLNFGLKALFGADYAMRFTPKLAARFGFNYNKYTIKRQDVLIVGETNRYDIAAFSHMSNLEALGEWSPSKKGKFRVVAGAGFFFKNEIGGSGGKSNQTQFNDVSVTPEEIGDGVLTVDWRSPISGYLGLAFGRLVPKKRVNLAFEMGGWLKGSPRFDIEATQLLTENERNEPILNQNFKSQKFWPNLSFRLGYRL